MYPDLYFNYIRIVQISNFMANYYFRLRDLNTDKETPIILFAQINGNRIKCKTNETILQGLWDNDNKVPVKCKANKILIERLDYLKTIANDTFLYFRDTLKNAEPNSAEYQNEFYKKAGIESNKPKVKPEPKVTFFEFIDKYINETKFRQNKHTGKPIAQNTIKVYNQCKRLLIEFNDTKYKIDFDKLTLEFFLDFMEFLHAKKYNVNTIAKHMTRLKTFLNDAYERGYTQSLAHKSKRLSVTQVQSDTIYLTEPEIEELHKIDLSNTPKLDRARDLFLVGYYTGQRYTDYSNIKPESFKNGFIEVTQQKTGQTVVIPIHPRLNEIMDKYEGKYINSLPPPISNQKFNQYIKEVCKLVDVLNNEVDTTLTKPSKLNGPIKKIIKSVPKYQLVSSHTARRSFATNHYNKGFSVNILMKVLGHTTETMFYKYIRVTPTENAHRLRDLWQLETSHLKVV